MVPHRLATLDVRRVGTAGGPHDGFYRSPEWRAVIATIKRERGARCEDPECATPFGPWRRIIGDHIRELRDGGAPLDKRNVLLRCHACHVRKTARERARRARSA